MKEMKINEPVIKSDAMASISQMIAHPSLYESGWLYQFYGGISFQRESREFAFPDYRLFREHGIFRKRYVEYPWTEVTRWETVCAYFRRCLEMQNYIIQYVDEFEWEGTWCKPCLLIYDEGTSGKAVFCCFGTDDELYQYEAEWKKIYEEILLPTAKRKRMLTFDLERVEKKDGYIFDKVFLRESLKQAPLNLLVCRYQFSHMNLMQKKKAARVLCEWFLWFTRRLDYMEEYGMLSKDVDGMRNQCAVAVKELMDKPEGKKLIEAVKSYNQLCRHMTGLLGRK